MCGIHEHPGESGVQGLEIVAAPQEVSGVEGTLKQQIEAAEKRYHTFLTHDGKYNIDPIFVDSVI